MALLLHNFTDTGCEGDGGHLVRCTKRFMPHFFQDGSGSAKYCVEALEINKSINQ